MKVTKKKVNASKSRNADAKYIYFKLTEMSTKVRLEGYRNIKFVELRLRIVSTVVGSRGQELYHNNTLVTQENFAKHAQT